VCVRVCVYALTPSTGDRCGLVFHTQLQVNVWFPGTILLGPLLLNYGDLVMAFSLPLPDINSPTRNNFAPVRRGGHLSLINRRLGCMHFTVLGCAV
jgi:hypothetical protein